MTAYRQRRFTRCKTAIQLALLTALAVFTFSASALAAAAGADESPGTAAGDVFHQLAQGKRLTAERTYRTPDKPTVYLTFDDGPSKLTGQVLDILAKEHIKATFFALGENAEAHPDMIKRILEEGHTLGNHSYNHVYSELYANFQNFWEQIAKTERIFQQIADIQPALVRAPGGTYTNFDPYYFYLMQQAGYTMIDWTADSGDSRRAGVPTAEIIQNVKASRLTPEINILFHDGAGHDNTVKALPEVIHYYKEKGYAFAPLGPDVKPSQFPSGKSKWKRSWSEPEFRSLLEQVEAHGALMRQAQAEPGAYGSQTGAGQGAYGGLAGADGAEQGAYGRSAGVGGAGQGVYGLSVGAGGAGQGAYNWLIQGVGRAQAGGQVQPSAGVTEEAAVAGADVDAQAVEQTRRQAETALAESQQALAQSSHPPLLIETAGGGLLLPQDVYSDDSGRIELPLRPLAERLGGRVDWEAASKTAIVHRGLTEIVYSLSEQAIRVYTLGQLTAIYHLPDMRLVDDSLRVSLSGALALLNAKVTGSRIADGQKIVAVSLPAGLLWKTNGANLRNSLYAFGG